MKKVMTETENGYPASPELARLFQQYERDIRRYNCNCWEECTTKELLTAKKQILWELAQEITQTDLMILYYAQHIEGLGRAKLFRALKARYKMQCAFQRDVLGIEDFLDISEIGRRKFPKKQKNH